MKLEAGKFYKCRNGSKAYVAAVGSPLKIKPEDEAIGWIDGKDMPYSWCVDGRGTKYNELPEDLVAEWREPIRGEAVVHVDSKGRIGCVPDLTADSGLRLIRIKYEEILDESEP